MTQNSEEINSSVLQLIFLVNPLLIGLGIVKRCQNGTGKNVLLSGGKKFSKINNVEQAQRKVSFWYRYFTLITLKVQVLNKI